MPYKDPKSPDRPYGHVVTFEAAPHYTETVMTVKRVGSPNKALNAARMTSHFKRVIKIEPYTREEWVRCFGEGRI